MRNSVEKIEELLARIQELETQNTDLRNELSFLRASVDHMPNPVFMKDRNGRFIYFNQKYAKNFSMTKEEYLGKTVLDLDYLPEQDREKYQTEDLQLIESGEICSYDKDFIFDDGKIHSTYYWSRGFVCPDTGEHGLVGEIVDISEEREGKNSLARIVRGAAYMFDRFFVLDLIKNVFTNMKKVDKDGTSMEGTRPLSLFFENTEGRFYSPLNNQPLDWCFTVESIHQFLKEKDDYYFECKDKISGEVVLGTTIYCIERENMVPTKVIYAVRDISDAKRLESNYRQGLKKANENLKDLANHDTLTGLYNRRGLREAINAKLTEESKVAVLLIDVDRFKSVNDSFGHVSGDKLLIKLSHLLKSSFRSNDILVRLGGDEFMAILLDCDYDHGDFIPQKIRSINEILQNPEDDTPIASVSAGVAFSRAGENQKLYNRADAALYKAKEYGRCNCCIYEDEFKNM